MEKFKASICVFLIATLSLVCCSQSLSNDQFQTEPIYSYTILAEYPHDTSAFTQGLVYHDGYIYEGTGLYGASTVRRVRLDDGQILQLLALPEQYFGEGITIVDDKIIQLTWQQNTGFVYDRETFALIDQFTYPTEGWGLTYDGTYLIMSDGSSILTYLEPHTFQPVKKLEVKSNTGPVRYLNELEYIDGVIYANIWLTDTIVLIAPENGRVIAWIDFSNLRKHLQADPQDIDVLNGIAYKPDTDELLVTGKLWPTIFGVRLLK